MKVLRFCLWFAGRVFKCFSWECNPRYYHCWVLGLLNWAFCQLLHLFHECKWDAACWQNLFGARLCLSRLSQSTHHNFFSIRSEFSFYWFQESVFLLIRYAFRASVRTLRVSTFKGWINCIFRRFGLRHFRKFKSTTHMTLAFRQQGLLPGSHGSKWRNSCKR